jgi:hypothetical protein
VHGMMVLALLYYIDTSKLKFVGNLKGLSQEMNTFLLVYYYTSITFNFVVFVKFKWNN